MIATSTIAKALAARSSKFLSKLIRYQGRIISNAEWIQALIAEGYRPWVHREELVNPPKLPSLFDLYRKHEAEWKRESPDTPWQVKAAEMHDRIIDEQGYKTVFGMWEGSSSHYPVTKTEWEYAHKLLGTDPIVPNITEMQQIRRYSRKRGR